MTQREQTGHGLAPDGLRDAADELIAAHQALLQALIRRQKDRIEILAEHASQSWKQFIIRLIERHTEMAASAALSLTRRHEDRITNLEQRLNALENHHNK